MNQPNVDDVGARRVIEVSARTVDEAVARGLVRLGGLSRAEVRIEVLNPGKGGVLGFGAEEALVRLTTLLPGEKPDDAGLVPSTEVLSTEPPLPPAAETAPPGVTVVEPGAPSEPALREPDRPEPPVPAAPPGEIAAVAVEVVRDLLRLLGFEPIQITVAETLLPVPVEDEHSLVLSIQGPGTQSLMAHEASALDALQFVARLILNRRSHDWANLLLDVDGDRARRAKELYQLAEQSAALVMREGRPVSLPPMSPYERRVVHLALHDHPTVATQSIGAGPSRKVTVRRKDQLLPEL